MLQHTVKFIQVIAVLGTFSSIGYYLMCLWATKNFLRERKASITGASDGTPLPVSILKPLKGTDPKCTKAFAAIACRIIRSTKFCSALRTQMIPRQKMVERLKAEFPQTLIRLVICPENLGRQYKSEQPCPDVAPAHDMTFSSSMTVIFGSKRTICGG